MKRILTVVGARPQFVKAAIVSSALQSYRDVREVLVHTGQHYDARMSEVFFTELGIRNPDINLGLGSGTHGAQTGRMLEALEAVIVEHQPRLVLVYGDTNSTLAGALAAAKLHVEIAHIEAGLRSHNRRMPEEINRVLTDHLADVLYTPTVAATQHLINEGIQPAKIRQFGDVMLDVALLGRERALTSSVILTDLGITTGNYVLATVHRADNTDDSARLHNILTALSEVATRLPVVLPLHPRTRGAIARLREFSMADSKIRFVEPVGYFDMLALEACAAAIVTDSGGVQKEAYFHGIPCVTIRDETEWTELVQVGWNRLAPPTSSEAVIVGVAEALGKRPDVKPAMYGDGNAAGLIADDLVARVARA